MKRFAKLLATGRPKTVGLILFILCCFIYLANGQTITSSDNTPTSILALNWLDNGIFHFDALRDTYFYNNRPTVPYFFVEAPNGHLTSTYPIGTSIITFPIYFLLWMGLRSVELIQMLLTGIPANLFEITDKASHGNIYSFQKIAATIIASLSVVLFYLSLRLKFTSPFVILLSTFIFAFCTTTWMISSQGLWQHGPSNLVVLAIIFTLLKANRATDSNSASHSRRPILLILTGFLCGLLPGIRPTSVIFSFVAVVYTVVIFRKEAIYLLLGLPSLLMSACWNFYFFGFDLKYFLVGGYSRFAGGDRSFAQQYYILTWQQFKTGFLGLLVSPSRGLLIFSPITLLAVPGVVQVFRHRGKEDEKLILLMTGAAFILFIQYCFFRVWTGGWGYGPRYMTDLIPVIGWLIAYCLDAVFQQWHRFKTGVAILAASSLSLLIGVSLFSQLVGAFSPDTLWDSIPYSSTERIWQWSDNQIIRHARGVYSQINSPIHDEEDYLASIDGSIIGLRNQADKVLPKRFTYVSNRPLQLTAMLQNTGQRPWFGYEAGLRQGLVVVEVRLFDRQGLNRQAVNRQDTSEAVAQGRLYVSEAPQPEGRAIAIGRITTPAQPGRYRMTFALSVLGLGDPPSQTDADIYEVELVVRPKPEAAQG